MARLVVERVARWYGRDREEVIRKGKEKPDRKVAVYLAKAVTGKTNREVGGFLGIKGSAVSGIVRRVERRLGKDERFRWEMMSLKGSLMN